MNTDKKSKKFTLVIPKDLHFAFKSVAAKEHRFMQDIATELFEHYLRDHYPLEYERYLHEKSEE